MCCPTNPNGYLTCSRDALARPAEANSEDISTWFGCYTFYRIDSFNNVFKMHSRSRGAKLEFWSDACKCSGRSRSKRTQSSPQLHKVSSSQISKSAAKSCKLWAAVKTKKLQTLWKMQTENLDFHSAFVGLKRPADQTSSVCIEL